MRLELLRARQLSGLPVQVIDLPDPCTNAQYEAAMGNLLKSRNVTALNTWPSADLFLADIKNIEAKLVYTGITPLFPLWLAPTDRLATE